MARPRLSYKNGRRSSKGAEPSAQGRPQGRSHGAPAHIGGAASGRPHGSPQGRLSPRLRPLVGKRHNNSDASLRFMKPALQNAPNGNTAASSTRRISTRRQCSPDTVLSAIHTYNRNVAP